MPTINLLFNDLQRLIGRKLPREADELNELLAYAKGEVESLEGDELSIEVKDGNRPDLWTVEGIARQLKGALGIEEGLKDYSVKDYSGIEVNVDKRLKGVRPYIACSVVRNVHLNDGVIREFMHLQDKLDQTYGRGRKRTSIGLYNLRLLKPPIYYGVAKPSEVSFTPLGTNQKMSLEEIVRTHPKGLEYGFIVKPYDYWPILHDAEGQILSFPPIINSNDLGRITEEVKDMFIEVTGTSYPTVLNTLMLVTLSVCDRGEAIYSTKTNYPYEDRRSDMVPKLEKRNLDLKTDYVNNTLGLSLKDADILKLLKKARYDAEKAGARKIRVTVPCYRVDVMHQVDLVEDIAMMFGYNNIAPRWPELITFGGIDRKTSFYDLSREAMIGLGFQEVLTFSMTDKDTLFSKMNLKESKTIDIANPMTNRYTTMRNSLLPNLMGFLSNNTHASYPQKVFEVGRCVTPDKNSKTGIGESMKLAGVIAHANASFTEAKAVLDAFFINMGVTSELKEGAHGSFIDGRIGVLLVGGGEVGLVGELHPQVIENWKLENPVSGFELDLDKIIEKNSKYNR